MNGSPWSPEQLDLLRRLYPDNYCSDVAKACGHSVSSTYRRAHAMGIQKTEAFRAMELAKQGERLKVAGFAHRIKPGTPPPNKGLRRPGWGPGRMRETQFKRGQVSKRWDPEKFAPGALRLNADGYVDIKVIDPPRAWRAFHVWLWEQENGPLPEGHVLVFRDRDALNIDLANLELITRAELCRRNSIHNLPAPLKQTIQLLGALKRTLNRRTRDEEQSRGSAQSPVRDAGSPEGQGQPDGDQPGQGGGGGRAGDRRLGARRGRARQSNRRSSRQRLLAAGAAA